MATDIHAIALEAEKATETLVTALAHAGASEATTQQITQCADVLRQVVEALGAGKEEEPTSMDDAVAQTHEAAQTAASERE